MKPKACYGCSEQEKGYGFFKGKFRRGNRVTVVVDEPESKFGAYGEVLNPYGRRGSVWGEVLRKLGLGWNKFNYESLIKCVRVGKGYRGKGVCGECQNRHGLEENRGLILSVGKDATEYLLEDRLEGKMGMGYIHGFVFETDYGLVMPIDELAHVKEGQFYLQHQVEIDIEKAIDWELGEWDPIGERGEKKYVVKGKEEHLEGILEELRKNPKKWLAYDIEGEGLEALDEDEKELGDYQIYTIQFSVEKHKAFEFRIGDSNAVDRLIRMVFKERNKKVGHNVWMFDNPILESQGYEIQGEIIDTLWMFKHYYPGGVRKHLQTVASFARFPFNWKHRVGERESIYPCADVDSLRYVYPWLRDRMGEKRHPQSGWSLLDGYKRHYVKKWPIMRRASVRGIPVDRERWEKLKRRLEKVREGYERRILEGVPPEIRKIKRYKTMPKEVRELYQYARGMGVYDEKKLEKYVQKWAKGYECYRDGEGWYKVLPFKLSNQQVMNYVKWKRDGCKTQKDRGKWTLQKLRKTGKETTGKDALDKLAKKTGDEWLNLIVESRSMGTTLGNMIENWKPKDDGAVHTEWHFNPPTGQMGSKKPNVLNMSKWNRLGQISRGMVYCPGDEWFIEFDKKSFHVAMLGFLAGDRKYYRASQLDIHSLFWVEVKKIWKVVWEWEDREIKKKIKGIRKDGGSEFELERQHAAKPTTLGNQLGLGAERLYEQNKPYVESIEHAAELQRALDRQYPEMAKWKREVRARGHRDKELMTWFGRIQRFYQIYRTEWVNGQMIRRFGVEHDKAPALEIHGNSFGVMDEDLLMLEKLGYNELYGLINMVHDNFSFRVKGSVKDSALRKVKEVLERPSEVLVSSVFPEGFSVGVDCSVGKNWRKAGKGNPNGIKEVEVN